MFLKTQKFDRIQEGSLEKKTKEEMSLLKPIEACMKFE